MQTISGETKLFGILSQSASFTLSPAMHNYAASQLHKDAVYCHFQLPPDKIEHFLDVFWHMGGLGLNVTTPYKNCVAALVDSQGLNSVNTLVRSNTGWIGHSTDGEGFVRGLGRLPGVKFEDFDAIITLGTGGAVQSILREISKLKYSPVDLIVLHRRTKAHDQNTLESLSGRPSSVVTMRQMSPFSFSDTLKQSQGLKRLIIQGTSAPILGDDLSAYRNALDFLTGDDVFVDLIYNKPSQLYHECNSKNLKALDGLPMLIEQARLSQFLWWGKAASYEQMQFSIKNAGWRG